MKLQAPALLNVWASHDSATSRVYFELSSQASAELVTANAESSVCFELRFVGTHCLMHPDAIRVLDGLVHCVTVVPSGSDVCVRIDCEVRVTPPRLVFVGTLPYTVVLELDRSPIRWDQRTPPIVIDPRCGGKNLGTLGPINLVEKHLNLKVALALKDALEDLGARTVLTRATDVHVPSGVRFGIAAREKAWLMVTVGMGQSMNPSTRGSRTRYARHSREARELACAVQAALVEKVGTPDLGVLPATIRPCAFLWLEVEPVVLTNKLDEALMRSPTFIRRIAAGIANGVLRFVRQGGVHH
ncbi:MAG: N-acetylmuramoyl-L-alanine amidase family protein [Bacillota bacterium]